MFIRTMLLLTAWAVLAARSAGQGPTPVYLEFEVRVPCLTRPLAAAGLAEQKQRAAAALAEKLDRTFPFWSFKSGPAPAEAVGLTVLVHTDETAEQPQEITATVQLRGAARPLVERPVVSEVDHFKMVREMGVELRWQKCVGKLSALLVADARDLFGDGFKRRVPVADRLVECQEQFGILPVAFDRLSDFRSPRFRVIATGGKDEDRSFVTSGVGLAPDRAGVEPGYLRVRHSKKLTAPDTLTISRILVELFDDPAPPPGLDEAGP